MWRKIQRFLGTLLPFLLGIMMITIAVCILNRWDSLVPITLIPIWAWSLLGMFLSLVSWLFCRNLPCIVFFCLWLVIGVSLSEETHGIARELIASIEENPDPPENLQVCVVNLHCAGKSAPLERAIDLEPDIIVIQEAPDEQSIREAAENLWGMDGSYLLHKGNAILARGEFLNSLTEEETATLHVRLRHPQGNIIDVTNIQLSHCAPSLDMWKPEVWQDLIEARKNNRGLVRKYLGENEITDETTGRIVSGGFGTPPGDDVYRPLISATLVDSYSKSGMGLGNTFPSNYAMLRLDQIWVSRNLSPWKTLTVRNADSEHRTVVTYLRLPEMER